MTSVSYPEYHLYKKEGKLDIDLGIGSLCVNSKNSGNYNQPKDSYFTDNFFNVAKNRFQLRHFLFAEYIKRGYILIEQIKAGVNLILKEVASSQKADASFNILPMTNIFNCKCGWLLFNPTTLPCGHTMCKHCADENLFCIICGYTICLLYTSPSPRDRG